MIMGAKHTLKALPGHHEHCGSGMRPSQWQSQESPDKPSILVQ